MNLQVKAVITRLLHFLNDSIDLPFAILILDFRPLYNMIILTFKMLNGTVWQNPKDFSAPSLCITFPLITSLQRQVKGEEGGKERKKRFGEELCKE